MTKFILGFSQEQKNCLITSSVSRRSLGQLDISQYNTQKGRKKKAGQQYLYISSKPAHLIRAYPRWVL